MKIKIFLKRIIYYLVALTLMLANIPLSSVSVHAQESGSENYEKGYLNNVKISVGGTLLPNYQFDKNQTEYNITITDACNSNGIGFIMELEYVDGFDPDNDANMDVATYYDGVKKTGLVNVMTPYTKWTKVLSNLNVPVGTTKVFSFEIGDVDNSGNFVRSDTYSFNITKIPSLNKISVTEGGNDVTLSSNTDIGFSNTFANEFSGTVSSDSIKLNASPINSAVKIYVGDSETEHNPETEISLASYKKDGIATVPLRLVYEGEGGKTVENKYTLKLQISGEETPPDYTPVIKTQPQNLVCGKDEKVTLSVEAEKPSKGTLSYQWYKGDAPVEGATADTYQPVTTGTTGASYYYCMVMNTVDGIAYTVKSDTVSVFVQMNYISMPVITKQPGTYTSNKDESPYNLVYHVGEQPKNMWFEFQTIDRTASYKYEVYYNSTDSYENAEIAEGASVRQQTLSTKNDTVTIQSYVRWGTDTTYSVGNHYFFVVITGYSASDSSMEEVSIKTDIVKLEYQYPDFDFDGSGSEDDPYQIKNIQDLIKVRDLVAEGEPFSGIYFDVLTDLELPGDWEPIGTATSRFAGVFDGDSDGDGNCITVTVAEDGLPLFGYVHGAEIYNLNIYGKKIAGYGLINSLEGLKRSGTSVIIDGVTLLEGTQTLKSGLLGIIMTSNAYAGASSGFNAVIRNCVIQKDVVIGYTGTESAIGSIAGRFQGTIENCTSYAKVYGKDYVGGLVGTIDNAMGQCTVENSGFYGTVESSGSYAGGIVGGGYSNGNSAPNGRRPSIIGCTVEGTIEGNECVGGITGGDRYVAQTWENVSHSVANNTFTGAVNGNQYVGGIIGYYNSLNKFDYISGNTYSGADTGIGYVEYIDTGYENPTLMEGTIAFNTGETTDGLPVIEWNTWKRNHNRTDDPLGIDADKLCRKLDIEDKKDSEDSKTDEQEPTDPEVTPTAEPTAAPTVTPTSTPTGTSTGASEKASAGSSATTGTRTSAVASTQAVKTGDAANLTFWLLALMGSCTALVEAGVNSRKRRK